MSPIEPITPRKYSCLSVEQPVGTFYVCAIPAGQILPLLAVERRGLSATEKARVQRALDPRRQQDIAKYARQSDATFPTSVTLSANSNFVHVIRTSGIDELVIGFELENGQNDDDHVPCLKIADGDQVRRFVEVPVGQSVALVIDGQHRIEGLKLAGAASQDSALAAFQLPFAFMFDLSPEDMAKIFVTINSTQRKVDSSHIADLFGLSSRRSPRRTCHLIAVAFNGKEGGPFHNGLKMLGRRMAGTEMLSQGSFCKYILRLISKHPEEDERRLQDGEPLETDARAPLREFFLDNRDEVILRILENYFSAASETYKEAWQLDPEGHLLRKTVGFSALVQLLIKIVPTALKVQDASKEAFQRVFRKIHLGLADEAWAVGKFSSSEADATRMCNLMHEKISDGLEALLKSPT